MYSHTNSVEGEVWTDGLRQFLLWFEGMDLGSKNHQVIRVHTAFVEGVINGELVRIPFG